MTDAVETMAYAGAVPWHGFGENIGEVARSEEMIVAAGLDWQVALGNLYGGPKNQKITTHKCVYRVSDNVPLGFVTNIYKPIQNIEVFNFLDSLVQDGILHYETAGSLRGGKTVWMLGQLTDDMVIAGDEWHSYLLGVTGHDANQGLRVFPTFERVVCANTLQIALDQRGRGQGINISHMGDIAAKMDQARTVMTITSNAKKKLAKWMEMAALAVVTEPEVVQVRDIMFGELDDETKTMKRNAMDKFMNIFGEEKERVGSNAYAMVNAVTGYADHATRTRTSDQAAEIRFTSVLLQGGPKAFKDRGMKAVATVAGLPEIGQIEL